MFLHWKIFYGSQDDFETATHQLIQMFKHYNVMFYRVQVVDCATNSLTLTTNYHSSAQNCYDHNLIIIIICTTILSTATCVYMEYTHAG